MLATSEAISSFAVDDPQAAREFYEGVLGLRISSSNRASKNGVSSDRASKDGDSGSGAGDTGPLTLHLAGGRELVIYPKADHVPSRYSVLNFPVDDIGKAVETLAGRGVQFLRYRGTGQDAAGVVCSGPGPYAAWFSDPAGNVLSVIQER